MSARHFNANPPRGEKRCEWVVCLKDGSHADCMRRAKVAGLCRQHARMRVEQRKRAVEAKGVRP